MPFRNSSIRAKLLLASTAVQVVLLSLLLANSVRLMNGARLPVSRWLSLIVYAIGGLALILLTSPLAARLTEREAAGDFKTADASPVLEQWSQFAGFPLVYWWLGGFALSLSLVTFAMRRTRLAIVSSVLASLLLGWHARIDFLPTQVWMQPTESARLALAQVCGIPGEPCADTAAPPARILALGYAEPSYVMTLGTQNLHPPETPTDLPADDSAYPVVYLLNLEDPKSIAGGEQIAADAARQNRCVTRSGSVYALNYSNGDPVHFVAIRFEADPCVDE